MTIQKAIADRAEALHDTADAMAEIQEYLYSGLGLTKSKTKTKEKIMAEWSTVAAVPTGNFEQPDTGMHQAVCAFVNNIGTQRGEYEGKPTFKEQVIISWELDQKLTIGDYAGMPFMISKFYTLSLHEKSGLRKDLENWRGKVFTDDELSGFQLQNLIGANCFLNLIESKTGKRKISAIMPVKKDMAKLVQTMDKPSEKYQAFIDKLRAQSIEMGEKAEVTGHGTDDTVTPF